MTKRPDWRHGGPDDLSVLLFISGTPPGAEAVNGMSWKEHWIKEPDLNTNFFCSKKKKKWKRKSRLKSKSVWKQQTTHVCFLQHPIGCSTWKHKAQSRNLQILTLGTVQSNPNSDTCCLCDYRLFLSLSEPSFLTWKVKMPHSHATIKEARMWNLRPVYSECLMYASQIWAK